MHTNSCFISHRMQLCKLICSSLVSNFLPSKEEASKRWAHVDLTRLLANPQMCHSHKSAFSAYILENEEWLLRPPECGLYSLGRRFFKIFISHTCVRKRTELFVSWAQLFAGREVKSCFCHARVALSHSGGEIRSFSRFIHFVWEEEACFSHRGSEFLEQTLLAKLRRRRTQLVVFVFFRHLLDKKASWVHTKFLFLENY